MNRLDAATLKLSYSSAGGIVANLADIPEPSFEIAEAIANLGLAMSSLAAAIEEAEQGKPLDRGVLTGLLKQEAARVIVAKRPKGPVKGVRRV